MGDRVFNGLAHFIKGGIFFLYGVITLGRWLGAFSELGWVKISLATIFDCRALINHTGLESQTSSGIWRQMEGVGTLSRDDRIVGDFYLRMLQRVFGTSCWCGWSMVTW